mmetsp:Transcript_2773/g.5631  ORF Transcript_2773/g.5631 Transcript_2773/m.5631 type:complete len:163 (+) Transcript_2773:77-565(+)|eukprot:CAMPEP_0118797664 /NCGR_PEP_ID=MMETSP1161-20130426/180_1 /TAXON_ID=249345 /ORGANISM="Picochlorum oklahomensis, Strain CCMP2329" /LENGTH=162 /DNA_ID=CAMNT_0006724873 /DNA_START=38 /DNA_END=526 /DNA_ORIENTATION=+
MAKYALLFLLATAACLGSALAACPRGSNTATTADGKPICIYCADGSGVTENFGGDGMSCSCPGGKECLVTIDGKEATFADYIKTTEVSTPEDTASVISEESSSSSSSSSSSEETSESSSSTSSSTTTTSPEPVPDSEAAASSAQLLKGALVAVVGAMVAIAI